MIDFFHIQDITYVYVSLNTYDWFQSYSYNICWKGLRRVPFIFVAAACVCLFMSDVKLGVLWYSLCRCILIVPLHSMIVPLHEITWHGMTFLDSPWHGMTFLDSPWHEMRFHDPPRFHDPTSTTLNYIPWSSYHNTTLHSMIHHGM